MTPINQRWRNAVAHRRIRVEGIDVFLREAGEPHAPVVLLPHGYPCSSYEFRHLMPALADRFRLVAPDFPGCGYSSTPDDFPYDFDGYARFLDALTTQLGIARFALYLHDFGSHASLSCTGCDHRVLQPGMYQAVPHDVDEPHELIAVTRHDPSEAVLLEKLDPVPFLRGVDPSVERFGVQPHGVSR